MQRRVQYYRDTSSPAAELHAETTSKHAREYLAIALLASSPKNVENYMPRNTVTWQCARTFQIKTMGP